MKESQLKSEKESLRNSLWPLLKALHGCRILSWPGGEMWELYQQDCSGLRESGEHNVEQRHHIRPPPGWTLSQSKRKVKSCSPSMEIRHTISYWHILACYLLQLQVRHRTLGSLHKALAWKSGVGVDDREILPSWGHNDLESMGWYQWYSILVCLWKVRAPGLKNKSVKGTWTEAFLVLLY